MVTSNYGATKEVSEPHGILVNPRSVEEIHRGIEQAVISDNKAEQRIKHALSFSWDKNVEKLRKIYSELANSAD